ncbi:hypothetical protein ACFW95_35745 [Streptomyces sp. NPDC059474]|uniref:hypothetical protein n=1 Tax=unclassified Streptomyces TaxID=2593676 RepID=UPI00364E28E8
MPRLVPDTPPQRVLAATNFVYTMSYGLYLTAGAAARSPLIRHYGGDRPQEFRAYLRAVTNLGISLGAVLAGWVVQLSTLTAYQLMVAGNAIAFLVAAAILFHLPPVTPVPAPPQPGTGK